MKTEGIHDSRKIDEYDRGLYNNNNNERKSHNYVGEEKINSIVRSVDPPSKYDIETNNSIHKSNQQQDQ